MRSRNQVGPSGSTGDRYDAYMTAFKRAYANARHVPFRVEGGAAAALLVHGFPGTPAEMRSLAETLSEAGWTVEAPLLPGFGTDIDTLFHRDYEDWLAAVRTAYRSLAMDHTPVLLIGHSMGAAVALGVAADVQPDGAILFAPFWRLPLDNPLLRLLRPILRVVIRRIKPFRAVDFDMDKVQAGIQEFIPDLDIQDPETQRQIQDLAIPTRLFTQLDDLGRDAFRSAGAFAGPTLILQGTDDDLVHPADTRRLLVRLPGPVEYLELPAGHDLLDDTTETWPLVTARVVAFAARLLARQTAR